MKQCDQQTIRGWFFLPDAPDQRVPGTLTWEPSRGATLELIGGFSPTPEFTQTPDGSLTSSELVGNVPDGTVFGVSTTGTRISIWEAWRSKYEVGMKGRVFEERWVSDWVCVGAQVSSPQETEFVRATIAIDDLYYLVDDGRFCVPQWAPIEGIDKPGETLDNGTCLMPYLLPVVGGYRAEYQRAETSDGVYAVNTNATRPWVSPATEAMPEMKLQFMRRNLRRGQVVALNAGASASIRLPQDTTGGASEFVDRVAPLLDLVRLATFDTAGVEEISLTADEGRQVSLLSRVGEPARPEDTHEPSSVIFDFSDVPLDVFLSARERLTSGDQAEYALSVVIGHCGYTPDIVEQYVSQVIAGAEGFHTWCLGNKGNVRLNLRLTALHERLPAELKDHLGLDVAVWAKSAVWARNHVAHGGTKRRRFIADSAQVLAVAKAVHLVVYLCLLTELGVPVDRLVEALRNHPRLKLFTYSCAVVNQIVVPN